MIADNSDWRIGRIVALTIGWLGVFMSCGIIYVICEYPGHFGNSFHETIIPFLPGEFFVIVSHFTLEFE